MHTGAGVALWRIEGHCVTVAAPGVVARLLQHDIEGEGGEIG